MVKKDFFIPIVLGTAREGRVSEKVARYVLREAKAYGMNAELVDVRDHLHAETIPSWVKDKRTDAWKKIATKADGFIIVSPEYNHGYPGELKILLDSAYEKEYGGKPVFICGVSNGPFGGARMVEHLNQVLVTVHMVALNAPVYFPKAPELFDDKGEIKDVSYSERLQKSFDKLLRYAEAMKGKK